MKIPLFLTLDQHLIVEINLRVVLIASSKLLDEIDRVFIGIGVGKSELRPLTLLLELEIKAQFNFICFIGLHYYPRRYIDFY